MPRQAGRPHFRLLGFPVHVGSGFVLFMILLAVVPRGGSGRFGIWLAAGVAVFTLIHELGHAVVARRAGAEAGISLEFMAGYTSYRPTRPITRPWTVAISLAGPLVHIASATALLLAMGVNPLDRESVTQSEAAQAIWWAGPVIGLINLVPVLPLDGGHVVATAIDGIAPGRGHRVKVYVSTVLTVAALVSTVFFDTTRQFAVFIGFLLLVQLSSLFAERASTAVSPFDAAAAAMRRGDQQRAVRILTRGLRRPSARQIVPAETSASPDDALRSVVLALPRPLPHGNVWNEYLLATLLVRYGHAREAAEYAAESYATEASPLAATAVARAAASLADAATAAGWLRAAREAGLPDDQMRRLVLAAPEFAGVRATAELQALLGGPVGTSPTSEPRRT
jgi:Zn-dependent protease